jgi:uncharacterized membrane protein YccC
MYRIAATLAGLIALALALSFFGYMVVSINAAPLWVIIGAACIMMVFDFYKSLSEGVD